MATSVICRAEVSTNVLAVFEKTKLSYAEYSATIKADHDKAVAVALKEYGKNLDKILDHHRKRANLDLYRYTEQEKDRFSREGTVSKPSPDLKDGLINEYAREPYLQAIAVEYSLILKRDLDTNSPTVAIDTPEHGFNWFWLP